MPADARALYAALVESARTTAMLFMILIGALMFAEFINITTMPNDLVAFVRRFEIHPVMVVAAICIIYVLLGTVLVVTLRAMSRRWRAEDGGGGDDVPYGPDQWSPPSVDL